MNWQAAEDALTAWVALMTATDPSLIAWDREPVGMRLYRQIDMRFGDHRARTGMPVEISYVDDGSGTLTPTAIGQRALTWAITVTTRDQHADVRAYQVLDALAVALELPYSEQVFESVGLSMGGVVAPIHSTYPSSEHRDLCQATLAVELDYVLAIHAPGAAATVETIEHVEVDGEVTNVTEVIIVPPTMMPPLDAPP